MYEFPNLLIGGKRNIEVGGFKLDNQLGQGSHLFENTGFGYNKKYSDTVTERGFLEPKITKRRSPSILDNLYN